MNSLSLVRLFAQLGVRYLTLTHTCHTSFASSAGSGAPIEPVHDGNGLTSFGRDLLYELNRLGVLIDLSHTSDETSRQVSRSHPANKCDGAQERVLTLRPIL